MVKKRIKRSERREGNGGPEEEGEGKIRQQENKRNRRWRFGRPRGTSYHRAIGRRDAGREGPKKGGGNTLSGKDSSWHEMEVGQKTGTSSHRSGLGGAARRAMERK